VHIQIRAWHGVTDFDADGMAHSGLLLADNNACQNGIPASVPPDLSTTKASKIHSRNILVESHSLGVLPIQQHLLLPSHIQSMGLGSRTSRPLLEHKPVAVIRCRRDRDSGCHHYCSPSSRNTSLTANTEVEVRGNMHIHNRYLVSLKRRGFSPFVAADKNMQYADCVLYPNLEDV
jgi:hypothetical protein